MQDTPSPDADLTAVGRGHEAEPTPTPAHWRSVLAVPLAALTLPVVAWAAGAESAPAADSGALAALGIMGLAWAGRRRL